MGLRGFPDSGSLGIKRAANLDRRMLKAPHMSGDGTFPWVTSKGVRALRSSTLDTASLENYHPLVSCLAPP